MLFGINQRQPKSDKKWVKERALRSSTQKPIYKRTSFQEKLLGERSLKLQPSPIAIKLNLSFPKNLPLPSSYGERSFCSYWLPKIPPPAPHRVNVNRTWMLKRRNNNVADTTSGPTVTKTNSMTSSSRSPQTLQILAKILRTPISLVFPLAHNMLMSRTRTKWRTLQNGFKF